MATKFDRPNPEPKQKLVICRGDRTASHEHLWRATETFVPHSPINDAPERGRGPDKGFFKAVRLPAEEFSGTSY